MDGWLVGLLDSQMASVWLSRCLNDLDVLCEDSLMASGLLIVGDDVLDILQVGSQMVSLCLIRDECGL